MLTYKDKLINDKIEKSMIRILGYLLSLVIGYRIFLIVVSGNLFHLIYFILYVTGLFFSILLLLKTHGIHFSLIHRFCTNRSGIDDCSRVISSKGAKIIGEISWSDIGVIYFLSLSILSVTIPFNDNSLIYSVSSFLAFPYVVFSIYYQWRVICSWCKMCLIVQIILFLLSVQSILFLMIDKNHDKLHDWMLIALVLLLILAAYFATKFVLRSLLLKEALSQQYKSFKSEHPDCNLFISEQIIPIETQARIIYNEEAPDKISVAFRFDCHPCLYHMGEIIETIQKNRNIAIEFIFVSWTTKLKKDLPVILYFATLYTENHDEFLHELNQYILNYPSLGNKFTSKPEKISEKVKYIITTHLKWCVDNKINQTPTFLVNDRITNTHYQFNELTDFLTSKKNDSKENDIYSS